MDGMVNTSELLINVVKTEQAKDADRLGPKGTVVGTGLARTLAWTLNTTGEQRAPNPSC